MYTLNKMKKELYEGEYPLLHWDGGGIPKEAPFVARFFPEEFCVGSFIGKDGKERSLNTILGNSSGAKSQRNKVFTGVYFGKKLQDTAVPLLQENASFWTQIQENCKKAILESEQNRDKLVDKFRVIGKSVGHKKYQIYLEQKLIEGDLATAYASLIIVLLIRDLSCVDDLLTVFTGTASLEDQYCYLDYPKKMMKRSFMGILKEPSFRPLVQKVYQDYSDLLGCCSVITSDGMVVETENGKFLDTLYEIVRAKRDKKLIQITGPSGAEKNAISQLLYLRLSYDVREGRETKLAPYYIDLGSYIRKGITSRAEAEKRMREDLQPFADFCKHQPYRSPLLFLDGIKSYALDDLGLDYILNQLMQELLPPAIYVIAVERGVVMNPHRQKKLPMFASGRYRFEVSMESVYLFDRSNSRKYLDKFREIYLPDEKEDLYARLRKLGFDHVDTYQLRILMGHLKEADNLCDLYEMVCMAALNGDASQLDDAAQWAFDFAYTDKEPRGIPFDLRQIINTHDSFVEYFIALYYIRKLRDGTAEDNVGFLNMVLPKGVTRFIVPMLNSNPADEKRMLDLIEGAYDHMGLMAKSEMTYWLGRIKAPSLSERAENLLLQYYDELKQEMEVPSALTEFERKRQLFLLRGICVSLIVKGHREVWEYYLESLLRDKLANEINRGFHLEYYGDKSYMPAYDTLDFEDDISKGQRTLDQLLAAIDMSRDTGEVPLIFELNLLTACSLLQARVEHTNRGISFDVIPYLSKAISKVDWYLEVDLCESDMLRQYFMMVKRDFQERVRERTRTWSPVGAKAYATYTRRILRTGWKDRHIPEPETVAEHIYNTWVLGMFLLPDEYSGDPEYSKQKILELVLIHDMAEAITGDISRPQKKMEQYEEERNEMGIMLLRGTYPGLPSQLQRYQLWELWDERSRDINGRIARELDLIQSMYMLLTYYGQYPDRFEERDVRAWLSERSLIRTIPGSKVLRTVIMDNQEFLPLLKKLGIVG